MNFIKPQKFFIIEVQELDMLDILNLECKEFECMFLCTLQKLALLKRRYIRANNVPKELCKAFMVRSRLRNKYMKIKTMESIKENKEKLL